MIKLIGAAMIAAACALGCASVLKEQRRRARELRSLCTALAMMRREMSLNLTALPELSKKLSECCDEPAAGFFRMTWLMCEELGDFEFCGNCLNLVHKKVMHYLTILGFRIHWYVLRANIDIV